MNIQEIKYSILTGIKEQQDEFRYYQPNAIITAFYRAILRSLLTDIPSSTSANEIKELLLDFQEDKNSDCYQPLYSILQEFYNQYSKSSEQINDIRIGKYIESKIPPNWEDKSLTPLRICISSILEKTNILENWFNDTPLSQWEGIANSLYRTAEDFSEFLWIKDKLDQLKSHYEEHEALALITLPPDQWLSYPPNFPLTNRQRAFIEAIRAWHLGELAKVEKRVHRWQWVARVASALFFIAIVLVIISITYGIHSNIIARERASIAATNAAIAGEVAKVAATDVFIAGTAKIESTKSVATAQIAATAVKNLSANQIAAQAIAALEDNYPLSLLLSIEAYQKLDTPQTKSSLFSTVHSRPYLSYTLHSHYGGILDVAFGSPYSNLYSLGSDNQFIQWDIEDNKIIPTTIISENEKLSTFAINSNGKSIAIGLKNGIIKIINDPLKQADQFSFKAHNEPITYLLFDHQGKKLASISDEQIINIWDAQNGELITKIKTNSKYPISSVVFSPDDQFIYCSTLDGNVLAWNASNGNYFGKAFTPSLGIIWQVSIDPMGQIMVATTNNGTIHFWDIRKWKAFPKPLSTNRQENILSARLIKNNNYLITNTEESISIWKISFDQQGNISGQEINRIFLENYKPIKKIVIDDQEKLLAVVSPSLTYIPILSIEALVDNNFAGALSINGHSEPVSSIAFNPQNSTQLASASWDKKIHIWEIGEDVFKNHDQMAPKKVLEGHEGYILRIAYSKDGKILASAGTDNIIRLWRTENWQQTGELQGHSQWIRALSFNENGNLLFSAGWDQELRTWDTMNNKQIGDTVKNINGAFYDMVYYKANDKQSFVFVSSDGSSNTPSIQKFSIDASKNTLQKVLTFGPNSSTYALALNPEQKMIAAGGTDQMITFWNIEDGKKVGEPLLGHHGDILSLAFSPDGKILASGSSDNKIILWDMETRLPLGQPLEAHKGFVYSLVFRDDGKILVSAGADGRIIFWDVDPNSWIKIACKKAGRNLSEDEWGKYFPDQPYRKTCPSNP